MKLRSDLRFRLFVHLALWNLVTCWFLLAESVLNILDDSHWEFFGIVQVHVVVGVGNDVELAVFLEVRVFNDFLSSFVVHPISVTVVERNREWEVRVSQKVLSFQRILREQSHLETNEDSVLSGALSHEDLVKVVLHVNEFELIQFSHSLVEVALDHFFGKSSAQASHNAEGRPLVLPHFFANLYRYLWGRFFLLSCFLFFFFFILIDGDLFWFGLNANCAKHEKLLDVLWVAACVVAHDIATKRVSSQNELLQPHHLTPLLKGLHKVCISFLGCLVFEGRPRASTHSNYIYENEVEFGCKLLHDFVKENARASVTVNQNQLLLRSL